MGLKNRFIGILSFSTHWIIFSCNDLYRDSTQNSYRTHIVKNEFNFKKWVMKITKNYRLSHPSGFFPPRIFFVYYILKKGSFLLREYEFYVHSNKRGLHFFVEEEDRIVGSYRNFSVTNLHRLLYFKKVCFFITWIRIIRPLKQRGLHFFVEEEDRIVGSYCPEVIRITTLLF